MKNDTVFLECNWNFKEVSNNELIACSLWEYARESETLLKAGDSRCWKEGKSLRWERSDEWYAVLRRIQKLSSDEKAIPLNLISVFYRRPWLDLSASEKNRYAKLIPKEVTPMRLAYLEELEALLEANQNIPQENIERLRKRGIAESELTGEKIKLPPFNCVDVRRLSELLENTNMDDWRKGCSVLAVTVNFAHYADNEIAEAFKNLLNIARPAELATPKRATLVAKRRGKSFNAWRVSLERLAVARLVNYYGPNSNDFPKQARELYKSRVNERQRRELEEAEKFFHKLFPFLEGEGLLCRQKARGRA
jgi:hypothetical protein